MDLATADLRRITTDVWATTVGLSLTAGDADGEPCAHLVTGRVNITGEWTGAVAVQCTDRLARRAAGRMFDAPPDQLSDEDVSDTIGELANITGGNVKSLLGAGLCQLSLPRVSTVPAGTTFPAEQVVDQVTWLCEGEQLVVTVSRSTPGRGTADADGGEDE